MLSRLKTERGELLSQLEDEKKKNEELQFRFEEAAITKGDIEVSHFLIVRPKNSLELHTLQQKAKQNVSGVCYI